MKLEESHDYVNTKSLLSFIYEGRLFLLQKVYAYGILTSIS